MRELNGPVQLERRELRVKVLEGSVGARTFLRERNRAVISVSHT